MSPRKVRVERLGSVRAGPRPAEPLPPYHAPRQMLAELHYLYSLLLFSAATTDRESMQYSTGTKCGRLTYERDGIRWVLVVREDIPDEPE